MLLNRRNRISEEEKFKQDYENDIEEIEKTIKHTLEITNFKIKDLSSMDEQSKKNIQNLVEYSLEKFSPDNSPIMKSVSTMNLIISIVVGMIISSYLYIVQNPQGLWSLIILTIALIIALAGTIIFYFALRLEMNLLNKKNRQFTLLKNLID